MENARVSRNGSVNSCQCPGAFALFTAMASQSAFQIPSVHSWNVSGDSRERRLLNRKSHLTCLRRRWTDTNRPMEPVAPLEPLTGVCIIIGADARRAH